MRLWHIDLIKYLPKKQLQGQWRELLAIKGIINKHGSTKSGLVDKVLNYNIEEYKIYTKVVIDELIKRKVRYDHNKLEEILTWKNSNFSKNKYYSTQNIFRFWHTDRYLTQCYYNLQEKYDCGMILENEWNIIDKFYKENKKWN